MFLKNFVELLKSLSLYTGRSSVHSFRKFVTPHFTANRIPQYSYFAELKKGVI